MALTVITPSSITRSPGGAYFSGTTHTNWYYEYQSLDIDYIRAPTFMKYVPPPTMSLSADTTGSYGVTNTILRCTVKASYYRKKVFGSYAGSFNQNQKFTVYANPADPYGGTYGALDASTLGPMGSILTSQPWIFIRPWVDGVDTEVSREITAYTGYIKENDQFTSLPSIIGELPNFHNAHAGPQPGSIPGYQGISFHELLVYLLTGKYDPATETAVGMMLTIDGLGAFVTLSNLFPDQWDGLVGSKVGFSEYSILKHDYT